MKAVEFCYWLQGVFEVAGPTALDERQTALVKAHLSMVFKHEIDPSYGGPDKQAVLDALHNVGDQLEKPEKNRPLPVAHDHIHPDQVLYRC